MGIDDYRKHKDTLTKITSVEFYLTCKKHYDCDRDIIYSECKQCRRMYRISIKGSKNYLLKTFSNSCYYIHETYELYPMYNTVGYYKCKVFISIDAYYEYKQQRTTVKNDILKGISLVELCI